MRIDFNTRSAEDYARFLAVRKCPIYQFKGSAAIVPDEYALLIGVKAKRKTGKKYTPAVKLFDLQQATKQPSEFSQQSRPVNCNAWKFSANTGSQ